MNFENISLLIQDQTVKKAVMEILEFEQSQIHRTQPRYKDRYKEIIEEAINETS